MCMVVSSVGVISAGSVDELLHETLKTAILEGDMV